MICGQFQSLTGSGLCCLRSKEALPNPLRVLWGAVLCGIRSAGEVCLSVSLSSSNRDWLETPGVLPQIYFLSDTHALGIPGLH